MLDYFDKTKHTNKKSVLIVDGNQKLCIHLASQIKKMGLSSFAANDSVFAEKIMKKQLPDLLIIDGDLPGESGMSLLESLGVNPDRCTIPVIVLCQNADLRSIRRVPALIAYYVQKSEKAWDKIETFIHELIDVNSTSANEVLNDDRLSNPNNGASE